MKKRKITVGILTVIVFLGIAGTAAASVVIPAANKAKGRAKAPDLEKIEFIHWKKGFAKPSLCGNEVLDPGEKCELGYPCTNGQVCENCKCIGGEEPAPTPTLSPTPTPTPTATCYAFMGEYGKRLLQWRNNLPVSYAINPTNPDGLPETFVTSAISAGAEEWDSWTGTEMFEDEYGVDYTRAYGVQDYVNTIAWSDYPTEGVIGVTTVWYNPATKTIVEFDVMFDTDWRWGDAEKSSAVMDLQNIATHELGHGVGLGDLYETTCIKETMYGYSTEGEIKKRDLEAGDIAGIKELYGN